jgi:hypothetical protein
MIRRLSVLLALLLVAAPASADETVLFPTVDALETTFIPPRDRIDLARRLRRVSQFPTPPSEPPAYALGDRAVFYVGGGDASGTQPVEAELRAIGRQIALWVDVRGAIPDEDLERLAEEFDRRIYPEVIALWGAERTAGVDGDPRIHGLFARGLGQSMIAYFASDHSYPVEAVPTSSARDMLFFNLDYFANQPMNADAFSVAAHELQHLIRHTIQPNEETWVNEGLSLFTEHYLYDRFMGEALSFLAMPDTQLNDWAETPSLRINDYGAAALFMVYLYQQIGLEGMQAFSADNAPRGWTSLDRVLRQRGIESAFGVSPADDLFADWVAANLIGDHSNSQYGYPSLFRMRTRTHTDQIGALEVDFSADARQYAADYYHLLNGAGKIVDLTVTLDAEAPLIPSDANPTPFFYSNRADMSSTRLTRAFDLTGVSSAALEFDLWFHIERDWDYGYVMISADGGATWDIQSTERTTTRDPYRVAYGAGYSGASGGWVRERAPLDAYAGREILVRFEMITDDAVTQPGMAIDNIAIDAIGYAADFDDGDDGWIAEGWLRTDNRLPQRAWVQLIYHNGAEVRVQRWLHPGGEARFIHETPFDFSYVYLAISPFAPVTTVPADYRVVMSLTPRQRP